MRKTTIKTVMMILACCLLLANLMTGCTSGGNESQELSALKETVGSLQHELTRLQAVNEIEKLMGRYEAIHNETDMVKTYMLFAQRPDSTFTVTADHIAGYDNIKSYFERMTGQMGGDSGEKRKGTMFEHPLATPVIEVAADGQTAKATWVSPGHETMEMGGAMGAPPGGGSGEMPEGERGAAPPAGEAPPPAEPGAGIMGGELTGTWCYGKYAIDFIKDNGEWKIWHLQWLRTFRTPFDTSWVDQPIEEIYGRFYENGQIIEKEGTYFKPYYPGKVSETVPAAPKPYETWTEAEEGWWLNETVTP